MSRLDVVVWAIASAGWAVVVAAVVIVWIGIAVAVGRVAGAVVRHRDRQVPQPGGERPPADAAPTTSRTRP